MQPKHGCGASHIRSRIQAMVMSYLRKACGVTRWNEERNEGVYERCGTAGKAKGMNLEW